MTAKINFAISQGSTFDEVLRWETDERVYKPITAITKAAPVVITSTGHELVTGWRIKLTDIVGMKELNSSSTYHVCTVADPNTVSINKVNSLSYTAYTSGGVIEYNKPMDLSGMTARMQIRARVDSDTVIHELTTENGGITINNTTKEIRLKISAASTAGFSFGQAVYNLEMIDSLGSVNNFARGTVTLTKEVTR